MHVCEVDAHADKRIMKCEFSTRRIPCEVGTFVRTKDKKKFCSLQFHYLQSFVRFSKFIYVEIYTYK